LLSKAGFIDLQRYVAVNGFFSENKLARPLHHFSGCPLDGSNNVTVRKPGSEDILYASCTDSNFKTDARLTLLSGGIHQINSTASLKIKFENTGETRFDSRTNRGGHISFSLR